MPTEMYNPPHPGRVLCSWLNGHMIGDVAKHLGVLRVSLSKVLNCRAGVSPGMSRRLSAVLGTNPRLWFDMQTDYDFAQAKRKQIPKIARLPTAT